MKIEIEDVLHYENLKTIKYTHLATTVVYAREIAKLLNYSPEDIKTIEIGASLHDIGKSLIPPAILNKKGRLDEKEREIINLHSILGYEILKSMGYCVNVAEIARDHHNPVSKNPMAQIVRAADIYSAMREERTYKKAKTHEEAIQVLIDAKVPQNIIEALNQKYGNKKAKANSSQAFSAHTAVL